LQHLSPLGWEHINLTGDYVWRQDRRGEKGKFMPLRPFASPWLALDFRLRFPKAIKAYRKSVARASCGLEYRVESSPSQSSVTPFERSRTSGRRFA
jgi:hypothetical protein